MFLAFIGASQGSILCLLFFLIYIINSSNYAVSPFKQFQDDLLINPHNAKTSANELNSNLKKKSERAYQWKM